MLQQGLFKGHNKASATMALLLCFHTILHMALGQFRHFIYNIIKFIEFVDHIPIMLSSFLDCSSTAIGTCHEVPAISNNGYKRARLLLRVNLCYHCPGSFYVSICWAVIVFCMMLLISNAGLCYAYFNTTNLYLISSGTNIISHCGIHYWSVAFF